ncbi:hypothetical protein ACWDXT_29770 [Streptomyces sp. NPDC003236]
MKWRSKATLLPVGARDIYAEPHWDGTVLLAANESSVAPALKE